MVGHSASGSRRPPRYWRLRRPGRPCRPPRPSRPPIADPHRPAADMARDAARKPAEMLAFAGVRPGETVIELFPAPATSRDCSARRLGRAGHVYAAVPDPSIEVRRTGGRMPSPPTRPTATSASMVINGLASAKLPPADLIWTSQNYHDMHLSLLHLDVAAVDRQWFALLKPGGVLLVIDHVAKAGAPVTATADALHRIDPAVAKLGTRGGGFCVRRPVGRTAQSGGSARGDRFRSVHPRQDRSVRLPLPQAGLTPLENAAT